MKNLFLFIFFLSYSISISQTSNSSLAASVELYPIAKSTSNPSASTYFSMELVSQVWGREVTGSSYTTLNTWLSNDYDFMTYTVINDNGKSMGKRGIPD